MDSRTNKSSSWIADFHNQLMRGRHLILTANIFDQFLLDGQYLSLPAFLDGYLQKQGYEVVAHYDLVDGLRFVTPEMQAMFARVLAASSTYNGMLPSFQGAPQTPGTFTAGLSPSHSAGPVAAGQPRASGGAARQQAFAAAERTPVERLPEEVLPRIRQALGQAETPVAIIIDFADKLVSDPERQAETERETVVLLKKCMQEAALLKNGRLQGRKNVLIIVAEQLGAVPTWLYQQNSLVAVQRLPRPRRDERQYFISRYFDTFNGSDAVATDARQRTAEVFTDLTDGLTAWDLETVRRTSIAEQISIEQPKKLVDYFKFGRIDDPWKDLSVTKIREALPRLDRRVRGQSHALQAAVNMLAGARGGISTKRANSIGGQPKGVLWFCGPTGVGKTELAKALTELVFGDEAAFARFDMSEYGQAHTRQRLIGAPPSYVGYDQGGELTGRCQERPFSLFLFDEIEKADKSLLDIFLQILDDGRLTDSKGQSAYFSKACLIFTSNIGGSTWTVRGTAPEDLPSYEEVREHYEAAVRRYFMEEIRRPELLNRLGNNIVVFDILRPEFFPEICGIFLDNLAANSRELYGVDLDLSDGRVTAMICDLMRDPKDFIFGGRWIEKLVKNRVETPLNRVVPFLTQPHRSRLVVSTNRENSQIVIDGRPIA